MPIVAIAGYGVYQAIAKVDLIVFNVLTRNIEDYFIIIPDAHITTHFARIIANARRGKLDAG